MTALFRLSIKSDDVTEVATVTTPNHQMAIKKPRLFSKNGAFYSFYDLRGYRLFTHISAALGGFMFAKRANRGSMRKSIIQLNAKTTVLPSESILKQAADKYPLTIPNPPHKEPLIHLHVVPSSQLYRDVTYLVLPYIRSP